MEDYVFAALGQARGDDQAEDGDWKLNVCRYQSRAFSVCHGTPSRPFSSLSMTGGDGVRPSNGRKSSILCPRHPHLMESIRSKQTE